MSIPESPPSGMCSTPDRVHRMNKNDNSVTTAFISPTDRVSEIEVKRSRSSAMRWSGLSVAD